MALHIDNPFEGVSNVDLDFSYGSGMSALFECWVTLREEFTILVDNNDFRCQVRLKTTTNYFHFIFKGYTVYNLYGISYTIKTIKNTKNKIRCDGYLNDVNDSFRFTKFSLWLEGNAT